MKKYLVIINLLLIVGFNYAQTGNVGIGTATPKASAALDITDANRGILIPRVALTATNAAGPIASPEPSLLVYNTATASSGATIVTPGYYYWDGAKWLRLVNGKSLNANNGLSIVGDTLIQLGGALIQATTITQANNTFTVLNNGTSNTVINLSSTGDFDIQDNGSSALFVRDDGNVGIGYNTPNNKLSVNGTIEAIDFGATGTKNILIGDDTYLTDIDVANMVGLYSNSDATVGGLRLGNTAGATLFGKNNNIGIDNTNPSYKLSVNGEIQSSTLTGTNNRPVSANSNGVLETKENALWTISSNMGSSPDDLSGGDLTADGADDVTYVRDLGFTIVINGISYTQVSVCTNGWIAFGSISSTSYSSAPLPLSFTNNPLILPYMTDLKDFGSGEWIREYKPSNNLYILEWRMRAYTSGSTNWVVRFQVQIHQSGLINVKYYDPMQPQLNGQQHTIDGITRNTVIGFQTDGGSNAKYHQITYNAKVMDDNNEISEGWSVSPVR